MVINAMAFGCHGSYSTSATLALVNARDFGGFGTGLSTDPWHPTVYAVYSAASIDGRTSSPGKGVAAGHAPLYSSIGTSDAGSTGGGEMSRLRTAGVALLAAAVLAPLVRAADEELSFKRRGTEEKRFVTQVGEAIVKAAHHTAKKTNLVKYEYTQPKANRTELAITMEYHGAATDKLYKADIVVKIDSSDKNAWEVLNIDYVDTNAAIKHNEKKIQDLIKQFNK
jgi:hypothetical protein